MSETLLNENYNSMEDFLVNYKPLVIKIARRYFLAGGDMDDVIQEGMIGLYKAYNTYSSEKGASFTTFATLCINRQIQTAIKKANAQVRRFCTDLYNLDNENIINIVSYENNPEDQVIRKESFNNFKKEILLKLTNLEKQILKHYLSGLSYDDIALELKITKKSVDNGLLRIRNKLYYLMSK